ncbi:MAG: hypothetical protein WAN11_17205 [Syntrophobacteraceae bacterium]
MEPNVFVQISSRNFERTGGEPRSPKFEASAPPTEKDFTLYPEEGIVELKMQGDVEPSNWPAPETKPGYDRNLTLRLSLRTCSRLVNFLQAKGLLKIEVSK